MNPFRRIRSFLCFAAVALFLLVPAARARQGNADADMVEVRNYVLTVDKIDRFGDAMHDLSELAQKDPQLASAMEADSDGKNEDADLNAIAQRFSAHPEVAALLKLHGYSPREFALCQMVIFQSILAEGAKQAGADPAKLVSDAHVNPANLTFVEQHKAEIEAMQKKYSDGGNQE